MATEYVKEEFRYDPKYDGSKVFHDEMMYVIEKNDAELYKLFGTMPGAYKQVKPDYTDKDGNYPFMIAYNFGNSEQAKLIYLRSGEKNSERQRQKDGYTILMIAIEKNDIAFAKEFCTFGGLEVIDIFLI